MPGTAPPRGPRMKAIVQEGFGSPDVLHLREIDRPVASDGQVLLRVRAASVNAADWHLLGALPHLVGRLFGSRGSQVRGIDVAGVVEAVGTGVTRLKPGDEVFGAANGSFAEYAVSAERRLAPKPGNLTFEQAAAIPVAGLTALQGLRDLGQVRAGQRVLVHGAGGGVGTFAVLIAKWLGAHVTAVTRTESLDLVRAIGADEAVDHTREDFTRRSERYDVIFDVGSNRSMSDCERVLAPGGRLLLVGAPKGAGAILARLLRMLLMPRSGRRIVFMARTNVEDLLVLKDLAESGALTPVIERQYALSEAPDALRRLGAGGVRGKLVVGVA